jgi:hypothetical protein
MAVLRIEHEVLDFDAWKRAFDADPVGRERSGVRRYGLLRAADDPNHVMVDLEFDSAGEAEAMLASLQAMWERVQGSLIASPTVRIAESVESGAYGAGGGSR